MKSKLYFPLFIDIAEKKIVVIGGGKIATRRVTTLLNFANHITVVAPEISEEIRKFVTNDTVIWQDNCYDSSCILDADMVLAATDDESCNEQIAADCRERGILVNVSHKKELCDFYFPSIVEDDGVVVGINASGKNHRKVKDTRKQIEEILSCQGNYSE